MQMLFAQWLVHASSNPLRDFAIHLLSQFDAEPHLVMATQGKVSPDGDSMARLYQSRQALVEPLSQRELEVLHLMALGKTNKEIAQYLILAQVLSRLTQPVSIASSMSPSGLRRWRARQLGILA